METSIYAQMLISAEEACRLYRKQMNFQVKRPTEDEIFEQTKTVQPIDSQMGKYVNMLV